MTIRYLACIALLLVSVASADETVTFDDASIEFFEKEVRPILVARCFECHSAESKSLKGGLRLDSRAAILKGGDTGPAVTLDKLSASLLVSAINYGDLYQMPPTSKLPANEIASLTKWVEKQLPWPKEALTAAGTVKPFNLAARVSEHWCWQPLKETAVPAVAQTDWPKSDVDRFILAKLESKGLHPAPSADKHALLRRVYFDLIGLPPTPEQIESFIRDTDPRAFERVVDGLLESAQFGERWCRHWLDLARYAETRGHEFEPIIPNAWQYRDYVIRALNDDVPYDRFLLEQVAGDLIPPRWRKGEVSGATTVPINESVLGTAFWLLGEEVHSPVDIRKDETDRMDNRLDVLSKTFLGLTVACARCHDHKFDAISQRDYYALAGYAISSMYRQVRVDTAEQHRQIAHSLDELRTQARRTVATAVVYATRPVRDQLDRYLRITVRAIDDGLLNSTLGKDERPNEAELTSRLDQIAKENSLDSTLLARWLAELSRAKADQRHPLNGLFRSEAAEHERQAVPGLVVDFGDSQTHRPMQDGVSFGLRPVERGRLVIGGTAESPMLGVATVGAWERDLFWKGITLSPKTEVDPGTLGTWQTYGRKALSPEFTLKTPKLWYLVCGSVRAYAAVNSHLIVMGPLHGSVLAEFKHTDQEWHWVSHGLNLYQGHRMHIEFSPADESACAVAMVIQSDEQPAQPESGGRTTLKTADSDSMTNRIAGYKKAINVVADSLAGSDPIRVTGQPAYAELADWFVKHLSLFATDEIPQTKSTIDWLSRAEADLAKQVRWDSSLAPAVLDGNGVDEYLLVRGNSNTPREIVPRRFLEAFDHGRAPAVGDVTTDSVKSPRNTGSGRLELARSMLQNPLAARVAVNRIWHHLFGRGIVPSVDNMGVLGLPPSHLELLDHLAIQFSQYGWSNKAMIRSLVLSRTYQMSSRPASDDPLDPDNQLWHRMPTKRLEGEVIRDSLLAVSGRLDEKRFGPSIAIHLTEFMQGRGRPKASGPLDGDGRRSIYISIRRNFLSPMMLAFDTPNPFSTVGRRTVSNVPAQALILMNDPFVIGQAKLWAKRILADSTASTEQRIDGMYLAAFGRNANSIEVADIRDFLKSHNADDPDHELEAWSHLCHTLFNLKEFIFVE